MMRAAVLATAVAWGPDGHETVGRIAELLNPDVAAKVQTILGESMSKSSTWADDVKHEKAYAWTEALHFINVPGVCTFDYDRDCAKDWCVAGAILNYTDALSGKAREAGTDAASMQEAVKFIIHFIGDLHQPLHVSFGGDRGGNSMHVEEGFDNDKKENLHAVWDSGIIDQFKKDENLDDEALSQQLVAAAKNASYTKCITGDLKTCLIEMAQESLTDACTYAYTQAPDGSKIGNATGDDTTLTQNYYTTRTPVIKERLAAGGARLAAVLAKYLPEHPKPGPPAPPAPPTPPTPPHPHPHPTPGEGSCKALGCKGHFHKSDPCHCNYSCEKHGDCCADYETQCKHEEVLMV